MTGELLAPGRDQLEGTKPMSVLSQTLNADGHVVVLLEKPDGTSEFQLVGELVLSTFKGPKPLGAELHHLDDDKTNNVLTNLQWKL